MQPVDIIIVGVGPAGVAAAVQCRRLGLSVRLIDETGKAGGLVVCANRIENYPGVAAVKGKVFAAMLRDHLSQFEVAVESARVHAVRPCENGFSVHTDTGVHLSQTAAVAVGTQPRLLSIPGATFANYTPLAVNRNHDRCVAIIGGGEAALDYALSLASESVKSTVIVRGDRLKARGRLVESACANEQIQILFNADPAEMVAQRDGLVQVRFKNPSTPLLRVHRVLAAIGRFSGAPELLKELDLGPLQTVSTPLPGLFVIGDARSGALGQVGTAVGDGLFAAMRAALHLEAKRGQ